MGYKKDNIVIEFITFNIIGLVNTIFCYLLFAGLIFLDIHYVPALIADYIVGTIISFSLNKKYTFRHDGKINQAMVLRMLQSVIAVFILNLGALFVLVDWFAFNTYLAQLVSLAIVAVSSYLIQKTHVFSDKHA